MTTTTRVSRSFTPETLETYLDARGPTPFNLRVANRVCEACWARKHCKGAVPGDGPFDAKIMLVGEAPGQTEDEEGYPFRGRAGRELNHLLRQIGLDRRDIFITNVAKCRPYTPDGGNIPPNQEVIDTCTSLWLQTELELVQPDIVVAMGAPAIHYFLGSDVTVDMVNGRAFEPQDTGLDYTVFATYHPAAGLHRSEILGSVHEAFGNLRLYLDGRLKVVRDEYPEPDYQWVDIGELRDFAAIYEITEGLDALLTVQGAVDGRHPDLTYDRLGRPIVAMDLEIQPDGSMFCWSAAVLPGTGYAFPPTEENMRFLRELCESPDILTVWQNVTGVDIQTLASQGIYFNEWDGDRNFVDDTMVRSYLCNIRPQGLKPVSYKLLGMKMDAYLDIVTPARQKPAAEFLRRVAEIDWGPSEPVAELKWDAALGEVIERTKNPWPLHRKAKSYLDKALGKPAEYYRSKAAKYRNEDGTPKLKKEATPGDPGYDLWQHWMDGTDENEKEIVEAVLGPDEGVLRDVGLQDVVDQFGDDPVRGWPRVIRYACRDADAAIRLWVHQEPTVRQRGLRRIHDIDISTIPIITEMMDNGMAVDRQALLDLSDDWQVVLEEKLEDIYKAAGTRFNLNAPVQVADVLYTGKGLPVQKDKGHVTTNAEALEKLKGIEEKWQSEDPEYVPITPHILEYRQYSKLKSTYSDQIPKLLDVNNRVHSRLLNTRTATGRLASAEPNVQNIPVRTELGRKIRQAFKASAIRGEVLPPYRGRELSNTDADWVLMGVDLSQIEVRMAAHIAQDEYWLEAFRRGADIHTATAALVHRIEEHEVTKGQRSDIKACVFGSIYGISGLGIAKGQKWYMPDGITPDGDRGDAFLNLFLSNVPGIRLYMDITKGFALDHGYVEDIFGRRRYIPEVYSLDNYIVESGLRQGINMPVQSSAQGMIKIAMRNARPTIDALGYRPYVRFINQIHDEILMEVHRSVAVEVGYLMKNLLETAHHDYPDLNITIPILADVEVGPTWGDMSEHAWHDLSGEKAAGCDKCEEPVAA